MISKCTNTITIAILFLGIAVSADKNFEEFKVSMRKCLDENHIPVNTIEEGWKVFITPSQTQGDKCFQACVQKNQEVIVDHKYHPDNFFTLVEKHFEEQKEFKFTAEEKNKIHDLMFSCKDQINAGTYENDCELAAFILSCKDKRTKEIDLEVEKLLVV